MGNITPLDEHDTETLLQEIVRLSQEVEKVKKQRETLQNELLKRDCKV